MEKLEVGQVWSNGKQRRKIDEIIPNSGYPDIRYTRLDGPRSINNAIFMDYFQKWIARTGAKLEGRDA